MALVKCRQCLTEVATVAAACPKCGAPPPRGIRLGRLFGIALIVTFFFVAWVMAQAGDGGGGAAPAAAGRMPDAKQVEIRALLAEYTDNEVRADAAFKGVTTDQKGDHFHRNHRGPGDHPSPPFEGPAHGSA